MAYDRDNVFARILRREIPCALVYENDSVLAFKDVAPKAPVHVLIVPKGAYDSWAAMANSGTDEEIAALFRAVPEVAAKMGLAEKGYRLIVNTGRDGGQEVPHLHLHLLGGAAVGPMTVRSG